MQVKISIRLDTIVIQMEMLQAIRSTLAIDFIIEEVLSCLMARQLMIMEILRVLETMRIVE